MPTCRRTPRRGAALLVPHHNLPPIRGARCERLALIGDKGRLGRGDLARIPHGSGEVIRRGGYADAVGCLRSTIRLCRILVYPRQARILNINNGVGVVLARKLCGRDG